MSYTGHIEIKTATDWLVLEFENGFCVAASIGYEKSIGATYEKVLHRVKERKGEAKRVDSVLSKLIETFELF